MNNPIEWLLETGDPWTRYRTLVDLLDRPEDGPEVQAARAEFVFTNRPKLTKIAHGMHV